MAACQSNVTVSGPDACWSPATHWPAFNAEVEDAAPGIRWVVLDETRRRAFLEAYNAAGVPSAVNYDTIGYFDSGQSLHVMAVLIERGCVWVTLPVARSLLQGDAA